MSTINPAANLIPGYCLSEVIGTGGFSTVYRATDVISQETVAIKVGRIAKQPETPEALHQLHATFEDEWRGLTRIDSEDVVRPIARGTTDRDKPYLILEYIPGMKLSDYQAFLAADLIPFDLRQVVILMLSAARAMGALHENDIIHNDIKLCNFRITEKGRVKLCDLGMAISVEEAQRVGYRNPRGTPGHYSAQTTETKRGKDVFGLGSAFYTLLTDKDPFPELKRQTSPFARLASHSRTPPSPDKARPERNIPQSVARIVMKAIHIAPISRYADAIEMSAALEKAARPIIGAKPRQPRR